MEWLQRADKDTRWVRDSNAQMKTSFNNVV